MLISPIFYRIIKWNFLYPDKHNSECTKLRKDYLKDYFLSFLLILLLLLFSNNKSIILKP